MHSILRTGLAAIILTFGLVASALAAGPHVNATSTDLALRGYDPVAYFTVGAPTPGDFNITAEHDGAIYRFASEENKATFLADPQAYVPAYGGYCAFGAAQGFKFDGDPEVWAIVDDKLYLNLAPSIQTFWNEDRSGFIDKANTNWKDIATKTPQELNQ